MAEEVMKLNAQLAQTVRETAVIYTLDDPPDEKTHSER
jgi:hypothetical protein